MLSIQSHQWTPLFYALEKYLSRSEGRIGYASNQNQYKVILLTSVVTSTHVLHIYIKFIYLTLRPFSIMNTYLYLCKLYNFSIAYPELEDAIFDKYITSDSRKKEFISVQIEHHTNQLQVGGYSTIIKQQLNLRSITSTSGDSSWYRPDITIEF